MGERRARTTRSRSTVDSGRLEMQKAYQKISAKTLIVLRERRRRMRMGQLRMWCLTIKSERTIAMA